MNRKKAKKLFKKYVNDQCSPEEVALLHTYLDSFQNTESFWSEFNYDDEIKEEVWDRIKSGISNGPPKKKYSPSTFFKYAAVVVCILGLAYLANNAVKTEVPKIYIEDDAIILRTSDNNSKEIVQDTEDVITGTDGAIIAAQHQNRIVYKSKDLFTSLVYNEIEVPRGKTFEIVLSDGTLVHLNSDSSLKFPVGFVDGEKRKVFLKGEAYFEVAKDEANEFVVVSNAMDVKVLGTHFNVSSYEDENAFAVLVEGSVVVQPQYRGGEMGVSKIMKPGQKADVKEDTVVINEVDVTNYLAWRNGNLVFNNESFKNIIEKIERRYNVSIDNRYQELGPVKFRGAFENETIEDLLNTFKESAGFDYVIIDNRIVIKKIK